MLTLKFWILIFRILVCIKLPNFFVPKLRRLISTFRFLLSCISLFHIHCFRCPNKSAADTVGVSHKASLRCYHCLNLLICGMFLFLIIVCIFAVREGVGEAAFKYVAVMVIFGFLFCVHFSRCVWLRTVIGLQMKIVDDASAYELERIAILAWIGIVSVTIYRCIFNDYSLSTAISVFAEWFIALLLWSPIVTLVGSGWRKLYVDSDNGKIFWPQCPKCSVNLRG